MYFKTNNPALIPVPAHTSARWNDGKQLDAGSLQILQNNVSTHQSQNNRTLATQTGGLSNIFFDTTSETTKRGFTQTPYTAPTDFTTCPVWKRLAWNSPVAFKFGPFYLPTTSTGFARAEYLPLNVAFEISGSSASTVYVAVNGGNNPFELEPYSIQSYTFGAGEGFYKFSITGIKEKPAVEENLIWLDFAGSEMIFDSLAPLYVWVGIYRPDTTVNFKSLTVSNPRLKV